MNPSNQIDQFLGLAALTFAVFLVLAAAVEAVLEALRGILGQFIPALKGAVPLDAALVQASEFAPPGGEVAAQLNALRTTAQRMGKTVSSKVSQAVTTADSVLASAADIAKLPSNDRLTVANAMNQAAEMLAQSIDHYERRRILFLRLLSAALGILLCVLTPLDIFAILHDTGVTAFGRIAANQWNGNFGIGEVVTGIAAASGSSYWHDKIDKVRSLKNINQRLAAVTRS